VEIVVVLQQGKCVKLGVALLALKRLGVGRENIKKVAVAIVRRCTATFILAGPSPAVSTVITRAVISPPMRLQDVGPVRSQIEIITGA